MGRDNAGTEPKRAESRPAPTALLSAVCAVGVAMAPGWQAAVACTAHVYEVWDFSTANFFECVLPTCLATAVGWLALGLLGVARPSHALQARLPLCAVGMALAALGFVVLCLNEFAGASIGAFRILALALTVLGGTCVQAAWILLIALLPIGPGAGGVARASGSAGAVGRMGDAVGGASGASFWPVVSALVCIASSVAAGFGGALAPAVGIASFLLPVVSAGLFIAVGVACAGRRDLPGLPGPLDDALPAEGREAVCPGYNGEGVAGAGFADGRPTGPTSLDVRHAVSFALLAAAFSLMTYNFLLTKFGRAEGWIAWAFVPGALCALGFLLLGRLTHAEGKAHLAYRLLIFPVVIAFFPFNPGTEESLHFAFFFTYAAMAAFVVIAPLLACDLAARRRRGLARSWGTMCGGVAVGVALGCLMVGVVKALDFLSGTYSIYLQAIACIVLSAIATNLLFLDREDLAAAYANVARSAFGGSRGDSRGDSLAKRCRAAAEEFGLTPREREVLQVLARGYTLSRVCENLGISQGTAISHRRSIYAKMGVHSQDELIDAVECAGENQKAVRGGVGERGR